MNVHVLLTHIEQAQPYKQMNRSATSKAQAWFFCCNPLPLMTSQHGLLGITSTGEDSRITLKYWLACWCNESCPREATFTGDDLKIAFIRCYRWRLPVDPQYSSALDNKVVSVTLISLHTHHFQSLLVGSLAGEDWISRWGKKCMTHSKVLDCQQQGGGGGGLDSLILIYSHKCNHLSLFFWQHIWESYYRCGDF